MPRSKRQTHTNSNLQLMVNGATGRTLTIVPQLVEKEVKSEQERVKSHNLAVMLAKEPIQMISRV